MAAEAENLDVRMEAIRLKNEELEKKHKEIMEDELLAKQKNATVDVKSSSGPTIHPYDDLELDFDVKDKEKDLGKNPDFKPKNRRPLPRKDLLDEIPPDPVNFLREDGEDKPKPETNANQQRPKNNNRNRNNNNNRQERPRPETGNNVAEGNTGDSPPRQRNQNQRPRPQQQQAPNQSPQEGNSPRKPPQQLRSERRSAPVPSQEITSPTGQSPQHAQPNRQRRQNNRPPPNKEGADRNNITVQITDGEVRSVKLKSTEKSFGTGRVGHYSRPDDTKFTVDTFDPESATQQDRSPQHDRQRNRNPRNNRRNPKPREFQHPTLENIVITKTSVQDRLVKIAKDPVELAEPRIESGDTPSSN